MSIESDIKAAFEAHADDARPTTKAFSAVEEGVRRYHRRRAGAMGALGVTLLVAGVVVAPRLVRDTDPGFAGPGGGSTESTEATLRPARRHFQLRYPADWQIDYDGAWYHLEPPPRAGADVPSGIRFSIIFQDDLITDLIPSDLPLDGGTSLGGQPAERGEAVSTDGSRTIAVAADWSVPCGCEVGNLLVVITSASEDAWDSYGEAALAMLASVEAADTFPVAPVHSALGTVEFGVTYDAATEAVAGYLDSRLFGGGYDYWLTQGAIDQYRAHGGPISNIEGAEWVTYSVRSREELADGTVRFTIAMVHAAGGSIRPGAAYPGETIEYLIVGPGTPAEADVPRDHVVVGVSFDG